jgi:hypothetical protein
VVKIYSDNKTTSKDFQKDQLVLLWNKEKEKPYFHTKFEALWIDPYQIEKVIGYNSYLFKDMKGMVQPFPLNGKYLNISSVKMPNSKYVHSCFWYSFVYPLSIYFSLPFSFLFESINKMEEDSRFSATQRGSRSHSWSQMLIHTSWSMLVHTHLSLIFFLFFFTSQIVLT